jgi:hypothetical protein
MSLKRKLPHLVLHFDVNETILLVDQAGGDTFEDCLNKIICKSALVRSSSLDPTTQLPTHWCDGTLIGNVDSLPPPPTNSFFWPQGTTSDYQAGGHSKEQSSTFTLPGSPGQSYRPLYEKLEKAVRWVTDTEGEGKSGESISVAPDPRLCHDGIHHFLLPAFFHTITELKKRKRTFSIVIRTFGTDVEDVVNALSAYAEGNHLSKYVPVVEEMKLGGDNFWNGSYNKESGTFQLKSNDGKMLTNENEIVSMFHGDMESILCFACTDDYPWWNEHSNLPSAGKPLWLTLNEEECLPIFFDDNIHNDADDSIVAVRVRETKEQKFQPLSGEETIAMQGQHLVRVPTFAPVLNENWFLEQIDACEKIFLEKREEGNK